MIMKHLLSRAGFLRLSLGLILVLGLIGGGLAFFWGGGHDNQANAGTSAEENEGAEAEHVAIPVKVVRPHYDKSYALFERRPADVHAYYQADLETFVPGHISTVRAAPGTAVKKGDILIEINVPDLKARVEKLDAAWKLTQAQVKQHEAAVETAEAEIKVAESKIKSTVAKWHSDEAYYAFRKKQFERYANLLSARAVDARLVDEQEDHREAAFQAVNASREAVETAKAKQESTVAQRNQALADLEAAKSKVGVAKGELDEAKAMLDYATVRAPFDGTITRRNVNPGDPVQNAGTGRAKPLLTIQRNDIVTMVVRVPDNYAAFITPQTEVIFQTPELPGVKIHGKVTRYPDSLENPEHDRTMLVEVDLWNGDKNEFEKLKDDAKFRDGLKPGMPNDPNEGLPIVPEIQGELVGGRRMHLRPGMFGQMTLVLRNFNNIYMLPSESIVSSGGNTYIYVMRDGKAHLQRVKVQVEDGKLVKVARLDENGKVAGDLTGKEEVIVSNLGELNEGQLVEPTLVKDWGALDVKEEKH
jgi:multidrug resistance efflux pump